LVQVVLMLASVDSRLKQRPPADNSAAKAVLGGDVNDPFLLYLSNQIDTVDK